MTITKTNKTLQLIKALPFICECEEPERQSFKNELLFTNTIENGTPYDRNQMDMINPENRLHDIDIRRENPKNKLAAEKGMALLIICMFASYLRKDYITQNRFNEILEQYRDPQGSSFRCC